MVVGINTSTFNNASTSIIEPDDDCQDVTGTLSDNSVSITILGNSTNTAHLASNITFTFPCDMDNGCDESFKCVWYNEQDDLWENEGCITNINTNQSLIECSCSHLTTFATIHNLHSSQCNAYYNHGYYLQSLI